MSHLSERLMQLVRRAPSCISPSTRPTYRVGRVKNSTNKPNQWAIYDASGKLFQSFPDKELAVDVARALNSPEESKNQ